MRFNPSLRFRLTLLVAGTMLPLIIFCAVIVYLDYERDRHQAAERVMQVTRGTISAADRELESVTAALQVLALSSFLRNDDLEGFRGQAERFAAKYPPGHTVVLTDRNGQQLLNTMVPAGQPLPRRTDLSAVRGVFETGRPSVSNVFMAAVLKRAIYTVDVPVTRNGEVVYDLSFNPPTEIFRDIIQQQRLPAGWIVSIVDRTGAHIARVPPPPPTGAITHLSDTLLPLMQDKEEGVAHTVSLEGMPLLTAFSRSPTSGWAAAIGMPSESLAREAWQSLLATLAIGAVVLLIGLAFAVRMATRLARAEAHRTLLINELNHRVKNTLSGAVADRVGIRLRGLR